MKKTALYFILGTFLLSTYSCKISRFVVYNFAEISDHKIFPYRTVQNTSNETFHFIQADSMLSLKLNNEPIEKYLEEHKTVAFLMIQNDTIKYEKYLNHYQEDDLVNSFSMAKSVTSMLIGCAIADGYIQSVNDPIRMYLPQLPEEEFRNVTIEHLLQMTSGMKFSEQYYNPFGNAASLYYGTNLQKIVDKTQLEHEPGTEFHYNSGSTQILGSILQQVLKDKSISEYLQEKIWTPLQMEYEATWSLDKKDGMEKTFCCLNARARDFAKLGRLYLNKGNWQGKQIVDSAWVARSIALDSSNGSSENYQYQWWLPNKDGDFEAEGFQGQFIYVSPEKNLIMVRLGTKRDHVNWDALFGKIKKLL